MVTVVAQDGQKTEEAEEMSNAKLGKRIKNCRLRLGKNQEEFGKMLTPPAAKNSVSQWEHGRNKPNKQRLKEIAKLCGTTVRELVGNGSMLTEKQKNCPYCHEKGGDHRVKMIEDDSNGQAGLAPEQDGWHVWIAVPHIFEQVLCPFEMIHPISYCPMCGRPLNEDSE